MKKQQPCSQNPGRVAPVVDRNRCEGKGDCLRVCPFGVFEILTITPEQRSGLTLIGKIKAFVHGGKQAFVVDPHACHACKLCLDVCPEDALSLQPLAN